MSAEFNENELPIVERAERYCAQGEQCRSGIRAKLSSWGATPQLADRVVNHLCKQGFIDEHRYVLYYADNKLRNQKWGRLKISYQLRSKQLSRDLIDEALRSIDPQVYHDVLTELAKTKLQTLTGLDERQTTTKLTSFLLTKGFEGPDVQTVVNEVLHPENK